MTILSTMAALAAVSGAIAMALTMPLPAGGPGTRSGPLRSHAAASGPRPVQAARVLSPGTKR